jgi:hypothetical protein
VVILHSDYTNEADEKLNEVTYEQGIHLIQSAGYKKRLKDNTKMKSD